MRDFSKVSPSLWHSERFTGLASDDAKLTYVYLLTSEHQTSAGCYRLPDAYAAADLRWTVERYQEARAELEKAGLVKHDAAASVIMVTRWFRFNPPMNPSHLKGIQHVLDLLPSPQIRADATAELEAVLDAASEAKCQSEVGPEAIARAAGKKWTGWKPRAVK